MSSQSCTRHPREPVPLPWARPSRPVLCGDCTQACLMQLGRSITDTCQIRPEPRWLELVTPTHDGDPRRGAVSRLALGHALPTGGPFSSCCRNQATFRASSNAVPEPSAGDAMGVGRTVDARGGQKAKQAHPHAAEPSRQGRILQGFIPAQIQCCRAFNRRASLSSGTNGE